MQENEALAKKIVELRLALRRVCQCEEGDKALLNLKTKALFVISEKDRVSPAQLMAALKVTKPNLTALAHELEEQELIMRTRTLIDRRTISYSITVKGSGYLRERLERIARIVGTGIENEKDRERAESSIDDVLSFLSFVKS